MKTPYQKKIIPHQKNQNAKQALIFRFIDDAMKICKKRSESFTGVELFCSDGFYANYAAKKNRTVRLRGIDLSEGYLRHARMASALLDVADRVTFEHCDVMDLEGEYDFAICVGGLYHLSDPFELLYRLRGKIRTALVIQTVFSLANTDYDYFETPAPGRERGCRFSYGYLLRMVASAGWKVKNQHDNELKGNPRLEDRGSAYLLCV